MVLILKIGTVMTDEKYRNRGFIKTIMNEIDKEYCELVEGIYLFANNTVLEFYTKFGFEKSVEYQYSKDVRNSVNEIKVQGFKIDTKENRLIIENAITNSVANSAFEMINNKELIMFYLTQFMGDNIYFFEEEKTYIIAEVEGDVLKLHNIFSDKKVEIDKIIEGFGGMINKVILEFTPLNKEGYGALELIKENTTLFVKGKGFDSFEEKRLMFTELSHA